MTHNKPDLMSLEDAARLIQSGAPLSLAGDERVLSKLPKGNWIAGSIPYFIGGEGGVFTQDKVYVTQFPTDAQGIRISAYDADSVNTVFLDAPQNGYSIIIIPGFSRTHQTFALNAPTFRGFASKPLIGWIAGFDLKDLGKTTAKVYDGRTGRAIEDGAVVLHVSLPADKVADIGTVNIFEQNTQGDELVFEADGFNMKDVLVNGKKMNLAEYVTSKKLDTRLPLVADYMGLMVNISFQSVDEKKGEVLFYAPVFRGIKYHQAKPVGDYVKEFTSRASEADPTRIQFSCNCILNYLYSELEGKKTLSLTGPITFGEVAYQLLNQTMVHLSIIDADAGK